jgi:hypothetical protein
LASITIRLQTSRSLALSRHSLILSQVRRHIIQPSHVWSSSARGAIYRLICDLRYASCSSTRWRQRSYQCTRRLLYLPDSSMFLCFDSYRFLAQPTHTLKDVE